MTLRSSDLQSDSDLDSIRNSCDVLKLPVVTILVPNCPVPNCPVPNCPGAKFSGCHIVHFYYLGAKLSAFIILVPNCPVLNCPVPNCPAPNCPTTAGKPANRRHFEPENNQIRTLSPAHQLLCPPCVFVFSYGPIERCIF